MEKFWKSIIVLCLIRASWVDIFSKINKHPGTFISHTRVPLHKMLQVANNCLYDGKIWFVQFFKSQGLVTGTWKFPTWKNGCISTESIKEAMNLWHYNFDYIISLQLCTIKYGFHAIMLLYVDCHSFQIRAFFNVF